MKTTEDIKLAPGPKCQNCEGETTLFARIGKETLPENGNIQDAVIVSIVCENGHRFESAIFIDDIFDFEV